MSRFRITKRAARIARHKELSVGALYIAATGATPVGCTVRLWLRTDEMTGMQSQDGGAEMANAEERIRFHLPEFAAPLRRNAVVSIEAGEAYRIDHIYPEDDQFQTARVVRLSASEAMSLPVPE